MKTRPPYFACILSLLLVTSCKKDPPIPVAPPVIVMESVQDITNTTLSLNVKVNPNNSLTTVSIEYGVTIPYGYESLVTEDPIGGDEDIDIDVEIAGLKSGQLYHYRLEAINSEGAGYSEDGVFTTTIADKDGNTYGIKTYGDQTWMTENLKTTRYRNGDVIVTSNPADLDLTNYTDPRYQWAPADNEANVAVFGRLYTWHVATDPRSLCPDGWHLPSDEEWTNLENTLIAAGYNYNGTLTGNYVAKALASTEYWDFSSVYGAAGNTDYPEKRNATGFNAMPAGYRDYYGHFSTIGGSTFWWTSTGSISGATYRAIQNSYSFVSRNGYNKRNGFSVRCARD